MIALMFSTLMFPFQIARIPLPCEKSLFLFLHIVFHALNDFASQCSGGGTTFVLKRRTYTPPFVSGFNFSSLKGRNQFPSQDHVLPMDFVKSLFFSKLWRHPAKKKGTSKRCASNIGRQIHLMGRSPKHL